MIRLVKGESLQGSYNDIPSQVRAMAKLLQTHIEANIFKDPKNWGNYRILQGQALSKLSRSTYKLFRTSVIVKFETSIGKSC